TAPTERGGVALQDHVPCPAHGEDGERLASNLVVERQQPLRRARLHSLHNERARHRFEDRRRARHCLSRVRQAAPQNAGLCSSGSRYCCGAQYRGLMLYTLHEAAYNSATPIRMAARARSEEHTSELQSLAYLVCRL